MIQMIKLKLEETSSDLKAIQEKLNHGASFSIMDYEKIQKSFSFERLTKEFFSKLIEIVDQGIGNVKSLDELDDLDLDLTSFCREQGLAESNQKRGGKIDTPDADDENEYISVDVLGENEKDERFNKTKFVRMLRMVEEAAGSIIEDGTKAELLIKGSQKFDLYFKNVNLKGDAFKSKTLAVIDDQSRADQDLFITSDGVVPVKHGKVDKLRRFEKVEYQGKSLKLGWPEEYSNNAVNLGNLYNLIEKLGRIRNN